MNQRRWYYVKNVLAGLVLSVVIASCNDKKASEGTIMVMPEAGTRIKSGDDLRIGLDFQNSKPDSVVYLLDSVIAGRKIDTSAVSVPTGELAMGSHLVTARVFTGSASVDFTSNIIVMPSKAPAAWSFDVVHTYPHDTSSYVEGLEFHDGILYESDGQYTEHGGSSLRQVQLETGKIIKKVDIDQKYFAEGITVIGDKIIQLTWKEGVGFVYDKQSFKKLAEFSYQAGPEGWGLAFDGKQVLNTDGSSSIHFLNKDSYQKESSVEVYDDQGPVYAINELEYIDGKIFANVYMKPVIIVIDPHTGVVEAAIDLSKLLPKGDDGDYVLNGIAWDAVGKRLFVTGKLWDKLYEIRIVKN